VQIGALPCLLAPFLLLHCLLSNMSKTKKMHFVKTLPYLGLISYKFVTVCVCLILDDDCARMLYREREGEG